MVALPPKSETRLDGRCGLDITTQGSPEFGVGLGAPAKMFMTFLEAAGRSWCPSPVEVVTRDGSISSCVDADGSAERVLVTARPTPAPENSTLTVIEVAAKAASRLGTTRGGGRPLPRLKGLAGGDRARAAEVCSSFDDAPGRPRNLVSGAIHPDAPLELVSPLIVFKELPSALEG